jgi:hypothetical protein
VTSVTERAEAISVTATASYFDEVRCAQADGAAVVLDLINNPIHSAKASEDSGAPGRWPYHLERRCCR